MRKAMLWGLLTVFALVALTGCGPKKTEAPIEDIPTLQQLDAMETLEDNTVLGSSELRDTVVHYRDIDGLVVPVMAQIPWEEGIAKATLGRMIESETSLARAGSMGLTAPIPANTQLEINIKNGTAIVNMTKEVLQCKDAAQEQAMVTAIVNTLVAFPAVQQVEFMVDGKKAGNLPHGTDVSKPLSKQTLNMESAEANMSLTTADQIVLYYEGGEGDYLVPVTRLVNGPATIEAAAREWVKGPKSGRLRTCLPDGCTLNSVKLENGLATFDFSKEFNQLATNTAREKHTLKALYLMCQAFDEVESVVIMVEGKEYVPGDVSNMAAPTFANSEF